MANPLRLIVGLGNPGREYAATRHNAGAWFAEQLATRLSVTFGAQAKLHAFVAEREPRLAVPRTVLNRSGVAACTLGGLYRIAPAKGLVADAKHYFNPGCGQL